MAVDVALVRRFAASMEVSERHARSMIRVSASAAGVEALVRKVTERIEEMERRRGG